MAACTLETSPPVVQPVQVISTQPPAEATNVSRRGMVTFFFDAPLHPGNIVQNAIIVTSGELSQPGFTSYDPSARALIYRPEGRYRRNLRYRARLAEGLRGLRHREQVEEFSFAFWVGEDDVAGPLPSVGALSEELATVLTSNCGYGGCHGPPTPAAGLDVSHPAALAATAVGQQSWQWWGWDRIAPGSAGWSYLVYKIIGEDSVLGDPMPPVGLLSAAQQERIVQWINGGAKVDLAPPEP
jgi:hypothetical protein